MSILVHGGKGGGTFTPHPAGQFPARCVDVVDLGWQETKFGWKYRIRFSFFCGEWIEREIDGETMRLPMTVNYTCTASTHEKANMRIFLESWRGKVFTQDEVELFDAERVLDAPAFVSIVHNITDAATYANIRTIMPLPKGMTAPGAPADYQRACEREDWTGPAPHPEMSEKPTDDERSFTEPDDDLPF